MGAEKIPLIEVMKKVEEFVFSKECNERFVMSEIN
jgi:hypothetical protein